MICRICGEDIDALEMDNVSPFCSYPVCENCKDDIMCEDCCDGDTDNLIYVEAWDKLLCKDCLVRVAEKKGVICSAKRYFDADWNEIGNDNDLEPVIDCIKDHFGI